MKHFLFVVYVYSFVLREDRELHGHGVFYLKEGKALHRKVLAYLVGQFYEIWQRVSDHTVLRGILFKSDTPHFA